MQDRGVATATDDRAVAGHAIVATKDVIDEGFQLVLVDACVTGAHRQRMGLDGDLGGATHAGQGVLVFD